MFTVFTIQQSDILGCELKAVLAFGRAVNHLFRVRFLRSDERKNRTRKDKIHLAAEHPDAPPECVEEPDEGAGQKPLEMKDRVTAVKMKHAEPKRCRTYW
jgi:hypothetical protein